MTIYLTLVYKTVVLNEIKLNMFCRFCLTPTPTLVSQMCVCVYIYIQYIFIPVWKDIFKQDGSLSTDIHTSAALRCVFFH